MQTLAVSIPFGLALALLIQSAHAADPATRPSGPANAVDRFLRAITDLDKIELTRGIAVTNADEQILQDSLAMACAGVGAYDAAMIGRFGEAARGKWGVAPVSPKTSVVSETDESARVALAGARAGDQIAVLRQNGVWKLTFAGVATVLRLRQVEPAIPGDEPLRRLVELAVTMQQTAVAIRDGEYATADAAAEAAKKAWAAVCNNATSQ